MKKSLALLFIVMFTLTSCGSDSDGGNSIDVDIPLEGVTFSILEVSKMPTELGLRTTHMLAMDISGQPDSNFRGYSSTSLLEIYDDKSQRCSIIPQIGGMDDVLVKGRISVIASIICYEKDTTTLTFIFKDTLINEFASVQDRVVFNAQNPPSENMLSIIQQLLAAQEEKERQSESDGVPVVIGTNLVS